MKSITKDTFMEICLILRGNVRVQQQILSGTEVLRGICLSNATHIHCLKVIILYIHKSRDAQLIQNRNLKRLYH